MEDVKFNWFLLFFVNHIKLNWAWIFFILAFVQYKKMCFIKMKVLEPSKIKREEIDSLWKVIFAEHSAVSTVNMGYCQ